MTACTTRVLTLGNKVKLSFADSHTHLFTAKQNWNKAPKVQMPRCSSMYARMQLADAYDSTYA